MRKQEGSPSPPGTSEPTLAGLDVDAYLRDPAIKQRFVTPMFDLVAPRYDDFTRRFSFGMDARWKRELLTLAASVAPRAARCLDVACGTGDLAFGLATARADLAVTGIDASQRMLSLADEHRRRLGVPNVHLSAGDLAQLPLPPASVDLVTAGYALRNAPLWQDAVRELARVVRPGGHLLTLDFYRPANPLWREMYLAYLSVMGRAYGWFWHREPVAYGYIARSIADFVSWQVFAQRLEGNGFRVLHVRPQLGGGIAMHYALRESAAR